MPNGCFDLPDQYDNMLEKGLRLSGENRRFFLEGRVRHLLLRLPQSFIPGRILDFGCGLGETSVFLKECFPNAVVVGVDASEAVIEKARSAYVVDGVSFQLLKDISELDSFDLCYCNGVFHHIPLKERKEIGSLVFSMLKPGGRFAFFENNPWNPGTRLIMRIVPFDRDAIPLSVFHARKLLKESGFEDVRKPDFLFFFTRGLSFFRVLEPFIVRFPLGGQYLILAKKGESFPNISLGD